MLEALLQQLQDTDPKTRLRAIYQIGIMGDPNALPTLKHVHENDTVTDLRTIAKSAAQHIQETRALGLTQDVQTDAAWTQQFLQYLQTSAAQFTEQDVLDLTQPVTARAGDLQKNTSSTPLSFGSGSMGMGSAFSGLSSGAGGNGNNTIPGLENTPKLFQNFVKDIAESHGIDLRAGAGGSAGSGSGVKEGTFQMLWDCPVCDTKGLLGVTHRFCPNCGAEQNPDTRYFPEPGTEVELINHKFVGKDKICPACSTLNSADTSFCGNCGSDMTGAEEASTRKDVVVGAGVGYQSGKIDMMANKLQADLAAGQAMSSVFQAQKRAKDRKRKMIIGGVGGTFLTAIAGFMFAFLYQKPENVTVASHEWQYEVIIHDFQARSEEKDCSDMPSGAYDVDRHNETRTRRVADGQTCRQECSNRDNGDGSFSRSCRDVCTTKYRDEKYTVAVCDYKIDRWEYERTVKSEGDGINVQAPSFSLDEGSGNKEFGKEKVYERKQTFILKIERGDGDIKECEFDNEAEWKKYQDGQNLIVEFNLLGMPDCDNIKIE